MKWKLLVLALISLWGMAGTEAWAKFGIAKTRAVYLLPQPPAFPTPGRQLSVQVTSLDPRGGLMVAPSLQQTLQQLLVREGFEVSPAARTSLQGTVSEAVALVERQRRWESVNVHVGEHTEKDAKGKEKRVEDCRAQQADVTYLVSSGSVAVYMTASDLKTQTVLFALPVRRLYREESAVAGPPRCGGQGYRISPAQLQDRQAILARLTEEAAIAVVPTVAGFAELKTVLLAVDDELKPGNIHAQAGNWERALEMWEAVSTSRVETEAARQYNLGVAHEALAAQALKAGNLQNAAAHVSKATEAHDDALLRDPNEKYFRDSLTRLFQLRQVLDKFQEYQSLERAEAARVSGPVGTLAGDMPEGEPRPTREFRVYVRQRLMAQRWEPSEEFQKKLAARGTGFGVTPALASEVVNSEVRRFLLLRQNQQKYQELFEDLSDDGLISAHERAILREQQKALGLTDELVNEVERQFRFKEQGAAQE